MIIKSLVVPVVAKCINFSDIKEAKEIYAIAQQDMFIENIIEAVGEMSWFVGLLADFAEFGFDIHICYRIWRNYNQNEDKKKFREDLLSFASRKNILVYVLLGLPRLASHLLLIPNGAGLTFNTIQSVALMLLWAKHCKGDDITELKGAMA